MPKFEYSRPMSRSEAEKTIKKETVACEKRDGDCIESCPFSDVREVLCPFEDMENALAYLESYLSPDVIKQASVERDEYKKGYDEGYDEGDCEGYNNAQDENEAQTDRQNEENQVLQDTCNRMKIKNADLNSKNNQLIEELKEVHGDKIVLQKFAFDMLSFCQNCFDDGTIQDDDWEMFGKKVKEFEHYLEPYLPHEEEEEEN